MASIPHFVRLARLADLEEYLRRWHVPIPGEPEDDWKQRLLTVIDEACDEMQEKIKIEYRQFFAQAHT